ncbi:DUF3618 domain-containing protein [Salinactinospora qingdaonensis]
MTEYSPDVEYRPGRPLNEAELLRAEISHTRAELGDTVEALAAKADVRTRAREEAKRAVGVARSRVSRPLTRRQLTVAAVSAGLLAGLIAAAVTKKRHVG